ncbi:MAG: hypothetical protein QOE64_2874 [Frankiales bacterium]|nr:hypothetical protein [Frankiales bacterium]
MLYLLLLAVGAILVGVLVAKIAARQDVRGEVERFHHARSITTSWAQQGTGVVVHRDPSEPDPAS